MAAFDFKKEFKNLYQPKCEPGLVDVPAMNFVAARGSGNPNDEGSEYMCSIELLYAVEYTIKMSKKGSHDIAGYFDYVVPPLEGYWWQDGVCGIDYARKDAFRFVSAIRLPDFVTCEVFDWAAGEAAAKKGLDLSRAEFLTCAEGLCVQCLHVGPYDDEPATVERMHAFAREQGCELDLCDERRHHEIYLSDPHRTAPEKLKTVVRHPVRPRGASE
jgi:hypothetical protein